MITHRMRAVHDGPSFDALMDDADARGEALAALGRHVGLTLHAPPNGSALVGLAEHEVVKCMAPHDRSYFETEVACLGALHGRLPVPTPELLEVGSWEGWPFLRMSRLQGTPAYQIFDQLDPTDQLDLARQVGEMLGVLHRIEAPAEVQRVDWPVWVEDRLGVLETLQRKRGCPEALLDGLTAFVSTLDLSQGDTGWLHTEVMREHLLIAETPQGWRLTGTFDFEPSWVGPLDYEYASVGLFVSCGRADLLDAVLRGSGRRVSPERLFGMAMMHRYTNLRWYHSRLGGPLEVRELPTTWFASARAAR